MDCLSLDQPRHELGHLRLDGKRRGRLADDILGCEVGHEFLRLPVLARQRGVSACMFRAMVDAVVSDGSTIVSERKDANWANRVKAVRNGQPGANHCLQ